MSKASYIDDLKAINAAQKVEIDDMRAVIANQKRAIEELQLSSTHQTSERERVFGHLAQSNMHHGNALVQVTWLLLRKTPKNNTQRITACYHEVADLFPLATRFCADIIPFPELVLPTQVLAALNIAGFNLHPVEKSHEQRGQIIGIADYILI